MSDSDKITRRDALATGGALVLAGSVAATPAEAAPQQVLRRMLGKTGETVPILLMGGSLPLDPRFDPKFAECMKWGVNYIDAADCYIGGACEPAVAAFHQRANVRNKLWITSKSCKHDPQPFEEVFNKSLEKLKTSYIDMYFLHMLKDPTKLNDDLKTVVARLKKEKKIKHFGFSCHDGNVAELLELAAKTPWVDAVMFRYNFREYGNDKLNRAMDLAHKAKVGLIAMKTQGSSVSFESGVQKFQQTGKWNKYQSTLKAVWADERISAAVSAMDSLDKVRENVAAALDKDKLTEAEHNELLRYAAATRSIACQGCDHHCGPAAGGGVQIGTTLRYLMYHDVYGQTSHAKDLFRRLPDCARTLDGADLAAASAACPHGVDLQRLMPRALRVLA